MSALNLWVQAFEFDAGIQSGELPVYSFLGLVSPLFPLLCFLCEPMMLVSYILNNLSSILQTKFSYGERHESSGMASSPMRPASCPSQSLSLVCKRPLPLLGSSETKTIGYIHALSAAAV